MASPFGPENPPLDPIHRWLTTYSNLESLGGLVKKRKKSNKKRLQLRRLYNQPTNQPTNLPDYNSVRQTMTDV